MAIKSGGRQKSSAPPVQQWGIKIRELREALPGKCSRTRYLFLYHTELDEFDAKRFSRFEIQEHTFARAERGARVKFDRVQIELLCKAGRATEEQRFAILTAANLDPFLDINGKLSQVGELCQHVTKLLNRSKHARRIAHNALSGDEVTADVLWTILQQILDSELADAERQKKPTPQVNQQLGKARAAM